MATEANISALETTRTQAGESLLELSNRSPILLVFLRHGGCPFCREMLANLQGVRQEIEAAGVVPVIIHMMPDDEAAELFGRYDLAALHRVSDPEQKLHRALELNRGSSLDVMGPKVWWAGFKSVLLRGHLPGKPGSDIHQLGGAFLIHKGEILAAHRSQTSFDQPDFCEIIQGEQES